MNASLTFFEEDSAVTGSTTTAENWKDSNGNSSELNYRDDDDDSKELTTMMVTRPQLISEEVLKYFSGEGGTKSDFVRQYPYAIYILLVALAIGVILNTYLVCTLL